MSDTSTTKNHPQLTPLTLWIMTIATGLVVANIYYNQPLLVDIEHAFHVSSKQAGYVAMLTQIGYAAGMLFIVPMADMLERKRLILIAFGIDVIALIAVGFAPSINLLLVSSFLVGAASLIPQLFVPMAAHLAKPNERGKKIGVVMSGLLIGILLSRTLSGFVAAHFGWRSIFFIAAGLMVVMGFLVFLFLPKVEPDYEGNYGELMTSLIHLIKTEPKLRFAAVRGALCFACFSIFWVSLPFLLHQNFNLGSDVAGSFGLLGAVGALAAGFMGRLSDKMDAFKLSFFTLLLIFISFVLFFFSGHSMIGLIIGVIVLDAGVQATHISNQAIIFTLSAAARNRINTIYMVSYFIGGSLGTLLVSTIWEKYQWPGVSVTGVALSLVAIVVHLLNHRSMQKRPSAV
jgi:predicted MFS family arabinose efflux permease